MSDHEIAEILSCRPTLNRRQLLKVSGLLAAGAVLEGGLPRRAMAAEGLVALVHTQAAGDNGPTDSMVARLKEIGSKYGVTTRTIYAQDPATYGSIFKTLGDAGATVVVTAFPQVAQALRAVGPNYPKTKFIHIFGDPIEPSPPNIVTVSYDYYLGCYLSGLFGAAISKSKKLGHIAGAAQPPIIADYNAMKAAAAASSPPATVVDAVAGSFQDPAKGHEIATQMYQSGVDYIQADSAATDIGIIQAANEAPGRLVSGVSEAQFKLGPKTIPAIVKLDFGLSLYTEVEKALKPDFKSGHVRTGLEGGVIDFELSKSFQTDGDPALVAKANELWPMIEDTKKKIIAGTLTVPLITTP